MTTTIIYVLGAVLFAGSIALLWISRMNALATPEVTSDPHDQDLAADQWSQSVQRFAALPSLTPQIAAPTEEAKEVGVQAVQAEVVTDDEPLAVQADIPNNEDAEVYLKLADQLQFVGDYEGVEEYAQLVLQSKEASPKQKDRAQALLRRDSSL